MLYLVLFVCLWSFSQATYDAGYPGRFSGYGDVNGDGLVDFCRFVCPKLACVQDDIIFCCHLQGSKDQCGYRSESGFESGKDIPGTSRTLIDANHDGKADYCRLLIPPEGGDAVPYCRLAGDKGWTQNEIRFDYVSGASGLFKKGL